MRVTRPIVVNLDDSVSRQEWLGALADPRGARILDLRDQTPKLRMVANRDALGIFSGRVAAAADRAGPNVFFLGSGDFNHLTYALLRDVASLCTVIHFDNHPDWVRMPPLLTCATWVNWALAIRNVVRVITIGPCGHDLQWPQLKFANLTAIREGRLEVFAWRQPPSRLWGSRPVDGACVRTKGNRLYWRTLADEPWHDFVAELCARLPTDDVWITIDKDVLGEGEAVTNWDQGEMTLDQILRAIARIAQRRRLLGVDVCGDYSPARFRDPLRAGISLFDRPFARPPRADAAAVNGRTNARIVAALDEILG